MKDFIKGIFLGLAILLLYAMGAKADYKATGKAEFIAIGSPSFLKINGTGGVLGCDLKGKEKVTGECKVHMKYLTTGLDLRDKHMKEKYLVVEKYEWASLKLDEFEVKEGESTFSGILTIKENSKPVKGTASLKTDKGTWKATMDFAVNIKDYPSIGVPSYLGITVADKVKVHVELKAN